MPWAKRTNLLLGILIVMFLLTRLLGLGSDVINPDGVNWHYRSEQFIVGLKTHDFARTFQHYHPGVTLMWIAGGAVELLRQVFPLERVYTHYNFLTFHFGAKFALVFVQLVLTLVCLYLLSQVWEFKKAFLAVLLFSLEPFFVGNSRLLHLDVLVSLFLFNGLIAAYLAFDREKFGWGILSGFFLALAFLTKSVAVGSLLFILLSTIPLLINKQFRRVLSFILPIFGSFVLTAFIFFPALWVSPVYTITEIFNEAERIGIRKGHGQIILGEYTRDGGILFYPLVLLMKLTPVTLVGVAMAVVQVWRRKILRPHKVSFLVFLTVFYLGYFVFMLLPSKKIDRYMLPLFPYLALVAIWGYARLLSIKVVRTGLIIGILAFFALPLVALFPYYFTYTSPIFGSLATAHKIVAQKPFGVGIPALKEFIFEKYGMYPNLGFYDVKPMGAIYPASKICDIRVCGTSSYDILVLGPNEEIPEKVSEGEVSFVHDSSMYINGLEYWKVYVKKN